MKYFVAFKILYQIILCLYFSISFGICYHPSLSVACQSHLADFRSNLFTSRILLFLCKMADPWRPMNAMPLKLLCAQDISSILYSVRIQTLLLVRDINGKKCQSKWILDAMRAMNNWTITYVMLFINVREILCLSAGMRRRFHIIVYATFPTKPILCESW